MAQIWTRYFTSAEDAMTVALNARDIDQLEVIVLGPVTRIRRPKADGSGLEPWDTGDEDHYVVIATNGELQLLPNT